MPKDRYESPLASRYASDFMLCLFSPDTRFQTWRRLWVALARAEHNLGLPVTAEQVAELEAQAEAARAERDRLEYKYRCESLINTELIDLCKREGVPFREALTRRPW